MFQIISSNPATLAPPGGYYTHMMKAGRFVSKDGGTEAHERHQFLG